MGQGLRGGEALRLIVAKHLLPSKKPHPLHVPSHPKSHPSHAPFKPPVTHQCYCSQIPGHTPSHSPSHPRHTPVTPPSHLRHTPVTPTITSVTPGHTLVPIPVIHRRLGVAQEAVKEVKGVRGAEGSVVRRDEALPWPPPMTVERWTGKKSSVRGLRLLEEPPYQTFTECASLSW